jgi:uncharacterized protein with HEPN domain
MPRDLRAYLWDIEQAAAEIRDFTRGKQLQDYQQDSMLRAAVERKFEIIGEALTQALRHFPEVASRITDHQEIVAFRNRLIHGYSLVSDALVWDIVEVDLPRLTEELAAVLRQIDEEAAGSTPGAVQ